MVCLGSGIQAKLTDKTKKFGILKFGSAVPSHVRIKQRRSEACC